MFSRRVVPYMLRKRLPPGSLPLCGINVGTFIPHCGKTVKITTVGAISHAARGMSLPTRQLALGVARGRRQSPTQTRGETRQRIQIGRLGAEERHGYQPMLARQQLLEASARPLLSRAPSQRSSAGPSTLDFRSAAAVVSLSPR